MIFKSKIAIRLRLSGESLRMAVQALFLSKMRSFLSLLMIAIGIFSIILIQTIIDSLEKNIKNSFESLGQNVFYIDKWPWAFSNDYPWWKYMNRPVSTLKESNDLKERLEKNPLIKEVAFMTRVGNKNIKYGANNLTGISGIAVTHDYNQINTVLLSQGRYFSEADSRFGNPVIILGYNLAAGLFDDEDPIGKEIHFMGRKVVVIGVMKLKGKSILGGSEDDTVVLPVAFLRKIAGLRRGEPSILVKVADGVSLDNLESSIIGQMRSIRRLRPSEDDNFSLNRITMLTKAIDSVFDTMSIGGGFIGFFALMVGGFGIANVMFVSVKERTNIIGIQKALGAKNSFILFQFLTEAVILSVIGGVLGIIFVLIITLIASSVFDFEMALTIGNMVYGTVISAIIGLLAGVIPAYIASRLDPVEAIRSKI